jgi:NADPH2:quinone reductase
MRAWLIKKQTGTNGLELIERPVPSITSTEVLVRLTAPGVVPFDAAIINNENEATFPPVTLPNVPGNQGAGTVEEPGGSGFKRGERVMFGAFPYGFMRPGSWAEFVAVEAEHLSRIPQSVPDGAAAQAAVAYPTAWFALREAGFAAGKTVLIPGIGGSVGNAAYQLARALGAAKVISTAGSKAKAALAQRGGFEDVIDLSSQSMLEGVHARNAGQNVDIVIDSVGGQVIAAAIKCLNRYGKAIVLGFAAGRQSTITLADLILVRGSIQGFGAYTSTPAEWRQAWSLFTTLADEGRIRPIFDRSFPFDAAPDAVRYVSQARPFGAVALTM